MSSEAKNSLHGKPWAVDSTHGSYEDACKRKELLLKSDGVQVKIRRRSDNSYDVKTRSTLASPSKSKKTTENSAKSKPKNRAARRAEKNRRRAMKSTMGD